MTTSRELLAGFFAACAVWTAAAKPAHWLWYPGDFEIFVAQEVQETRLEWGGVTPVMWPQYHHYPVVAFRKTVELAEDETMTVEIDGKGYYNISGIGQGGIIGEKMDFKLAKGRHTLFFKLVNSKRLPSLRATARSFVSDSTWEVEHSNSGTFLSAACNGYLCDSKRRPSDFRLATESAKAVSVKPNGKGGLIADFGKETYGFPVFENITGSGRVRIIYGESEKEALADGLFDDKLVIKPNAADVWEYLDFRATDRLRLKDTRAFRYINVVPVSGDVKVGGIAMEREYNADLKVRGAFECDDAKLNEIWRVCEYTLQLTAREFLIDGIKRDRWVWSGDAKQSALLSYYVYGEREVVRRTLWALRGKDPVWRHINTISDYTFYWFEMVWEYYLYTGDGDFLKEIYPMMKTLMQFVESRVAKEDDGWYVTKPNDWTFVDWAPKALENGKGPVALLQMLLQRAYAALAEVARTQGDQETSARYAAKAEALKRRIVPAFWNDAQGGLVHALGKDGRQLGQFTRYANMFGIFYDYFDKAQTASVIDRCLLNDKVMPIVTPYMRFYELEAHCAIGRQAEVTKEMRSYWGGMLDLGATSFWELYDPREKGDQHYAMYGRTFGRSFCHAWGASPAYLLGRYYLGVTPTKPGFAAYAVHPNLGGLKWLRGKVPTPDGEIAVEVRDGQATVRGPKSGTGTLYWNGRTASVPAGATVTLSADAPAPDVAEFDPAMAAKKSVVTNGVKWIDARYLPVEGKPFAASETATYFERLPKEAVGNEGVKGMKNHTTGIQLRFVTDSKKVTVRWKNDGCAFPHMTAIGRSGIDIYRLSAKTGKWRYVTSGWPNAKDPAVVSAAWTPGEACLINLPLYNKVEFLEVGVETNATVSAPPPHKSGVTKPVVFYGTSITHGGCCTRPGLSFVNIVGRDLDIPVVNEGYSGSGRMELEMCDWIAKIDASCYVLDCLWNMSEDLIASRFEPFVRALREKRPDTPILVAESCEVYHLHGEGSRFDKKHEIVRGVYAKLKAEDPKKWAKLYYLDSDSQMSDDGEGTVDGCHPNDLGMRDMAKGFGAKLREILGLPSGR